MSDSDSDSGSDYGGGGGRTSTSIQRCLRTFGIDVTQDLGHCTNLTEEFTAIKKAYFKKILQCHPDKGGDAAIFREVNSSFELIRKLYEDRAVASFATSATKPTQDRYDFDYSSKGGGGGGDSASSSGTPWKSWQYYYDAAEEEVPHYKVELARSGRSKCNGTQRGRTCGDDRAIAKGEIRIGSIDRMSGTYGRWIHLECWRVPSRIWQGLAEEGGDSSVEQCVAALSSMNEVNLTGFKELSPSYQHRFAAHSMDRGNWASAQRRKPRPPHLPSSGGSGGSSNSSTSRSRPQAARGSPSIAGHHGGTPSASGSSADTGYPPSSTALSFTKQQESVLVAPPAPSPGCYVVPRPGVDGALSANFLLGKTIVLTGIFPEIGGGTGLNLGKDRLKAMCESFGARVTSSISGKTDMLIVGKEPGASKVGKARDSAKCKLISLADFTLSLQGEQKLESAPDASEQIESFSAGYLTQGMLRMGGGQARHKVKMTPSPTGAKKVPKKRAPAKPKPEPRAKKSAAAKKSASGSKKKAAATKASAPKEKKTATKWSAPGRKGTAATASTSKRRSIKKEANVDSEP